MQTPRLADRWLHASLGAVVGLPLFAFAYGTRGGRVAFVLFQEPKVAAIQILGWSLLAGVAWLYRGRLGLGAFWAALLRPPWRWLVLFLAYGAVTVFWVAVRANLFYELSQYLLLLLLVLALGLWADRDPAVPKIVQGALVASLGAASLVGLIQGIFPIAPLSPIDPGSGVANPSFLGYKNPMALALAGQFFLLAGMVHSRGLGRRSGRLLALLLVAELVYLGTLNSRTSYLALGGATLVLIVLLLMKEGFSRRALRIVGVGSGLAALFVLVVAIEPVTRGRALSMLSFVAHPARYLESDRGTYLVNSLHMVGDRPLGVGLGDWQSQYPVYRQVRRDLYFTPSVQVRSAHSDHVQYLAETGGIGFALWVGFWVSLLALPIREFLRSGQPRALLLAAQAAAFGIAMATDYVTQHPYLKFEFLLVAFLVTRVAEEAPVPREVSAVRPGLGAAVLLTALAVAAATYQVLSVRKAWLGAEVTAAYLALEERGSLSDPDLAAWAEQAARAGDTMAHTPGYHRELADTYRILAALKLRLGHREEALKYARASLRLAPYSPNAMRLMASLLRDRPAEAAAWDRAATYVMDEATAGFKRPYPAIASE